MAMTLSGSTEWPSGKELIRFAEGRSLTAPRQLRAILEQACDALSKGLAGPGIDEVHLTSKRSEVECSMNGKAELRH